MRHFSLILGIFFIIIALAYAFQGQNEKQKDKKSEYSDLNFSSQKESLTPHFTWIKELKDSPPPTKEETNLFRSDAQQYRKLIANFAIGSGLNSLGVFKGSESIGPGAFSYIGRESFAILDTNNQRVLIKQGSSSHELMLSEHQYARGISSQGNGEFNLLIKENDSLIIQKYTAEGNLLDAFQIVSPPKELLHYAGSIHIFSENNETYIENFGNTYQVSSDGQLELMPGTPLGDENYAHFEENADHISINIVDHSGHSKQQFDLKSRFDSLHSIKNSKDGNILIIFDHVESALVDGREIFTPTKVLEKYSPTGELLSGVYLDHQEHIKIDQDIFVNHDGKVFQLKAHKRQFLLMEISI